MIEASHCAGPSRRGRRPSDFFFESPHRPTDEIITPLAGGMTARRFFSKKTQVTAEPIRESQYEKFFGELWIFLFDFIGRCGIKVPGVRGTFAVEVAKCKDQVSNTLSVSPCMRGQSEMMFSEVSLRQDLKDEVMDVPARMLLPAGPQSTNNRKIRAGCG